MQILDENSLASDPDAHNFPKRTNTQDNKLDKLVSL